MNPTKTQQHSQWLSGKHWRGPKLHKKSVTELKTEILHFMGSRSNFSKKYFSISWWRLPLALSLRQFEPKGITLPSFKQEAVFSTEQGCNQINKDLQVSSSSAIPPLVCGLCIIYSHKEKVKENTQKENPLKEICSLRQAGQAQKGNIYCHQSAPGRVEGELNVMPC